MQQRRGARRAGVAAGVSAALLLLLLSCTRVGRDEAARPAADKAAPPPVTVRLSPAELGTLRETALARHAAAQRLRHGGDPAAMREADAAYVEAAELYARWLAAAPAGAPERGETRFFRAEALFWSGGYAASVADYRAVFAGGPEHYRADACYSAVEALSLAAVLDVEAGNLVDPGMPVLASSGAVVSTPAVPMPAQWAELVSAADACLVLPADERGAGMALRAALVVLRHRQWAEAERRLDVVIHRFCKATVTGAAAESLLLAAAGRGGASAASSTQQRLAADSCVAR